MDGRYDPDCEGARALDAKHREQSALLVGGGESQLASIVQHTQERQLLAHLGSCARCSRYRDPRCSKCGFDTRVTRHGWRCARALPTWTEWLPWNWRPKLAPARAETVRVEVKTQAPRAKPSRFDDTPLPRPSKPASAAKPQQQPLTRSRSHPPAAKPSKTPLVQAYATLGLTSAANPEQVRKAFRERAQQYHPDKVAQLGPEVREVAERKMKEINEAYERVKRSWS